ncbi:MAG TPA: PAS domain S-box protein, partial [Patescibacteria group bacterium]
MIGIKEVCRLVHCHPNSLYRWEKQGLITSIRFGARGHRRYQPEDVNNFLNHHLTPSLRLSENFIRNTQHNSFDDDRQYYDAIRRSIPDSVIATDNNYIIKEWNRAAEKLYGWKAHEAIGRSTIDLLKAEFPDNTTRQEIISQLNQQGYWQGEVIHRRKDGSTVHVFASSTLIKNRKGITLGTLAVNRDIGELKLAAQKIREQAKLLQAAYDSFIVQDDQNRVFFWNKGAQRLYGFTKKEVMGKTASKILSTKFPIPIDKIHQTIKKKGSWEGELRQVTKKGKEIIVDSRWVLIDDNKSPLYLEVNRDITDYKNLVRQKDEFLGVASHELKTPVTTIKAYAQFLALHFKRRGDPESAQLLDKMNGQINKLTLLINDLLDVTRIQAGKLELRSAEFNLNELITETVGQIQLTSPRHRIEIRLVSSLSALGDRDRIGQVLINY